MSREDRLPNLDTLTKLLGSGTARAIFALLQAGAPRARSGQPWAIAFGGKPQTVAELAAIASRGIFTMYRDLAKASRIKILRLVPGPTRAAKILEFALPWPPPSADSVTPGHLPSEASHVVNPGNHGSTQPVHQPQCCPACTAILQALQEQVAALTAHLEQVPSERETARETALARLRPTPPATVAATAPTHLEAPVAQSATSAVAPPVTQPLAAYPLVLPLDTPVPGARTTVPGPMPGPAPLTPSSPAPVPDEVAAHRRPATRLSPAASPDSPRSQTPALDASVNRSPASDLPPSQVHLPEPILHVFRGIVHRHPTPSEAARIAAHLNRFQAAGADMGDLIRAMYVAEAKYKPTPERPHVECEAFFEKYFHRELRDFVRRRYGRPTPRSFATARRSVPPPCNVILRRPDREQIDYESFYTLPPASCARVS